MLFSKLSWDENPWQTKKSNPVKKNLTKIMRKSVAIDFMKTLSQSDKMYNSQRQIFFTIIIGIY